MVKFCSAALVVWVNTSPNSEELSSTLGCIYTIAVCKCSIIFCVFELSLYVVQFTYSFLHKCYFVHAVILIPIL